MNWVKSSLRGRLLFSILPVLLAAIGLVSYVATETAGRALDRQTDAWVEVASTNLARTVQGVFDRAHKDLTRIAHNAATAAALDGGDPSAFSAMASQLVSLDETYSAVLAVDANGRIAAANRGPDAPIDGQTVQGEAWFQRAMNAGSNEVVWIPLGRPKYLESVLKNDERVFGLAIPVGSGATARRGGIAVFVRGSRIREVLAWHTKEDQAVAMLLDHLGNPVLRPTSTKDDPIWLAAAIPDTGGAVVRWEAPDGRSFLVRDSMLGGAAETGSLATAIFNDEASAIQMRSTLSTWVLLAFLLATILGSIVLYLQAGRFIEPISRLTRATKNPDDLQELPVQSIDEVGRLTSSFNRMLRKLRGQQRELEERVMDRTRELTTTKEELGDILDHMQQAVLTVNAEGFCNREYSAFTTEVFGEVPVAEVHLLDLLQLSPDSNPADHSRMQFWLDNIFGADELQWSLCRRDTVKTLAYEKPSSAGPDSRYLELGYEPIFTEGALTKVMVIAKDVTEMFALREEVERRQQDQKNQVDRIAELSRLEPETFALFIEDSELAMNENYESQERLRKNPSDSAALAQIIGSTEKLAGNARIFAVDSVADQANELLDMLRPLQREAQAPGPATIDKIEQRLTEFRVLIAELGSLGKRLLQVERFSDAVGEVQSTERLSEVRAKINQTRQNFVRIEGGVTSDWKALRVAAKEARKAAFETGSSMLVAACDVLQQATKSKRLEQISTGFNLVEQAFVRTNAMIEQTAIVDADDALLEDLETAFQVLVTGVGAWRRSARDVDFDELMRAAEASKAAAMSYGITVLTDPINEAEETILACAKDPKLAAQGPAAVVERLFEIGLVLADVQSFSGAPEEPQKPAAEPRALARPVRRLVDDGSAVVDRLATAHDHWKERTDSAKLGEVVYLAKEYQRAASASRLGALQTAADGLQEQLNLANRAANVDEDVLLAVGNSVDTVRWLHHHYTAIAPELENHAAPRTFLRAQAARLEEAGESAREVIGEIAEQSWEAGMPSLARMLGEVANDREMDDALCLFRDADRFFQDAETVRSARQGPGIKVAKTKVRRLEKLTVDLSAAIRSLPEGIPPSVTASVEKLGKAVESLSECSLTTTFDRVAKLTHDLSRDLGKPLEDLEVRDTAGAVPETMSDKIRQTLLHAVRNAVEHGIEETQTRVAQQKPSRGRVRVLCRRSPDAIVVEVRDDGRGVDFEAVRRVAVEDGVASAEAIQDMSEADLIELLFLPGFSTLEDSSDTSGRGVGLDAIRSIADGSGGAVKLRSSEEGCVLMVRLPLRFHA